MGTGSPSTADTYLPPHWEEAALPGGFFLLLGNAPEKAKKAVATGSRRDYNNVR